MAKLNITSTFVESLDGHDNPIRVIRTSEIIGLFYNMETETLWVNCGVTSCNIAINLDKYDTLNGAEIPESMATIITLLKGVMVSQTTRTIEATMDSIRAITGYYHGQFVECLENSYLYRYDSVNEEEDNGDTVLCPDDNVGAGRWIKEYQYATD